MQNSFQAIVKEKSDEELLTMVYQFDQWNSEMLEAVQSELEIRHKLPGDISIRQQKIVDIETEDLKRGKEASLTGQIAGWIGVLGILGLIIGYNYAFSKSRSKYTQEKFYKYDEASRENGRYIFYISLTVHILYVLYKIGTLIQNSLYG